MAKLTRGERFKDARTVHNQHNKQTMDEVAAATGVSKSLIQSLEDDSIKRSVGYDKVTKLAEHYGVTTDYLLGLSDDPFPEHTAADDLGLSPKAVKTILQIKQLSTAHDGYLGLLDNLLTADLFQPVLAGMYKFVQAALADNIYQTTKAAHFAKYGPVDGYAHIEEFYDRIHEIAVQHESNLLLSNILRYFTLLDRLNTDKDNDIILPDASVTPTIIFDAYKKAPADLFAQLIQNLSESNIRDFQKMSDQT